jgi:biopolymer transport protein ExbD
MAMQLGGGPRENEPMMDINTTPLIDVMLVLLIMLILTIPIQTHGATLDMPRPTTQQPTEPDVIALEVDFDGVYYWNDVEVDRSSLERRLQQAAVQFPQPELHIRPHNLAEYRYVAAVLASAQRLGLKKIMMVERAS